jgi:hypothetical protein
LTCQTCEDGYDKIDEERFCSLQIENCQTYLKLNSEVICSLCNPNFKPNVSGDKCFQFYDSNCLDYDSTENGIECNSCASSFILISSDKKCYSEISGCAEYIKYFNEGIFERIY